MKLEISRIQTNELEVFGHLIRTVNHDLGQPLWQADQLTPERLLQDYGPESLYLARLKRIPVATFVLIESVSLTPLGDWLFGTMMGASAEVTRLAKAAAAVTPTRVLIRQGEVIVRSGDPLDAVDIEKIDELGLREASPDVASFGGWFLLAVLIVGLRVKP